MRKKKNQLGIPAANKALGKSTIPGQDATTSDNQSTFKQACRCSAGVTLTVWSKT